MTSHATPDTSAAARQARRRARLAEAGVEPINLLVPVGAHPFLKDIAARLRTGEPLAKVLQGAALKASGRAFRGVDQSALAVPDDLKPGPGEVAVAVRLTKNAAGGLRRWIIGRGLVRRDDAGAWVGVLSPEVGEELHQRVEAVGGTVVERLP